jgi:hypothetical protein
MTDTTVVLEEWEGHNVTGAALDINIGHGLKEAMRVQPELFRAGTVIDIVTRVRIENVRYKPSELTEDKEPKFDGPWTRVHIGKPLAALPLDADSKAAKAVRAVIERHIADVAKAKEMKGQQSLLDEEQALVDKEERLAEQEAGDDFYDSETDADG